MEKVLFTRKLYRMRWEYFIRRLVYIVPAVHKFKLLSHLKCLETNSELNKCKSHLACGQYQRSILRPASPAMPFKKFKPKFSIYQVCVTILEAKHLPQNANPLVVVKVGNRKKRTVVRERTDNPIYNEVKLSRLSKLIYTYKALDSKL